MFPCGSSPRSACLAIAHLQQLPASRSCKLPAFTRPITRLERSALLLNWHRPNLSPLLGGGHFLKGPFLMWS